MWVNGGQLLGKRALETLREIGSPILLYNNDDPTGKRDGNRWLSLKRALPCYDLCAVLRDFNQREFLAAGARAVHRVWMSYDEVVHQPAQPREKGAGIEADVSFVGTWMPERGGFLAELLNRGVSLCIWGGLWQKAPEWNQLKRAWRGENLTGRSYAEVVAGSKICLGLLSKENRDSHTRRSVEIPAMGGVLCAKRTDEHRMLFAEGKEAAFWSDAEECADVCSRLIANDAVRRELARNGTRRVHDLRLGNEDICSEVLELLVNQHSPRQRFWHP